MYEDDNYEYIEQRRLEYEKWVKEKSIRLEVGKTYLQKSASWAIKHYKILSADNIVALGIVVYCGINNSKIRGCGEYALFRVNTGEKYQEPRLNYALIEEVKR
jgi:hypothetical protein